MNLIFGYGADGAKRNKDAGHQFLGMGLDESGKDVFVFRHCDEAIVNPKDLNLDDDIFVVVSERDTSSPYKSHGAIVMESYTAQARLDQAMDRIKSFNGRYGKSVVARLEFIEDPQAILDSQE